MSSRFMAGTATPITDPTEVQKVGGLMFGKFPQIADYVPPDADPQDIAMFRIELKVISLFDYRNWFGHTQLIEP